MIHDSTQIYIISQEKSELFTQVINCKSGEVEQNKNVSK